MTFSPRSSFISCVDTKIRTTAAIAIAGSLVLAGALSAPAQAIDDQRRSSAQLTDFGYRGDVYGVKLVTDNVEAFNLKDAHAQLRCTRAIGQFVEQPSVLSRPGQPADQHRGEHEPDRHLPGRRHPRRPRHQHHRRHPSIGGTVGGTQDAPGW